MRPVHKYLRLRVHLLDPERKCIQPADHLGNFEGIEINGYIFRTLFVNEDNRIFATVEEKNEDGETINDFIVLVD